MDQLIETSPALLVKKTKKTVKDLIEDPEDDCLDEEAELEDDEAEEREDEEVS